jgi:CRP-like cAMP-binding protein
MAQHPRVAAAAQFVTMFLIPSFDPLAQAEVVSAGQLLRQRGSRADSVLYLDSGCVVLGVRDEGQMRHQLGVVEGPAWLDAAFALTGRPCGVDMVTDSRVRLRRISLQAFQRSLDGLPDTVATLVRDMAYGYCQQTETAVSRLAQDAETRCAQWLLRHAQHADNGTMRVTLNQRKRTIAAQLGIAPETFSRVLRHLREHGLIAGTGNVLNLPQPSALQSVAGM